MRVVIEREYEEACQWTADYIAKRINVFQPDLEVYFNLGLSPGLSRDHSENVMRFMKHYLFALIDVDLENVRIPSKGEEMVLVDDDCLLYEQEIEYYGGIELFLAGLNDYGNIGGNEQGSSLSSRSRMKTISCDVIRSMCKFTGYPVSDIPVKVATIGLGTLMESNEIVLLMTGEQNSKNVQNCLEGGISSMCPPSAFQGHNRCTYVIDDNATSDLLIKTVRFYRSLNSLNIGSSEEKMDIIIAQQGRARISSVQRQRENGKLTNASAMDIDVQLPPTKVDVLTENYMGNTLQDFSKYEKTDKPSGVSITIPASKEYLDANNATYFNDYEENSNQEVRIGNNDIEIPEIDDLSEMIKLSIPEDK